jgi:DNA-binding response OmpR family regulator
VSVPVGPVLLVEDDPDHATIFAHAWKRAGCTSRLLTVGDGDAAVAYLAGIDRREGRRGHGLPSLVVLDLKLPKKSGFEVLEWIRTRQELEGIRVVVLTSSGESGDKERTRELGANAFYVKPVSLDDLVKTIIEIRDGVQQAEARAKKG